MNKDKDKNFIRRNWAECVALSVLVHFIVLYFLIGDLFIMKFLPSIKGEAMDVYVVSDDEIRRQVVSIDDEKGDDQPNPNARFLSKVNRTVDQETRAKYWGRPKNRVSGVQSILEEDIEDAISSYMEGRKKITKKVLPAGNSDGYGDSTTYDYLPGIKPGEKTVLNTSEFVYYSFYRRVQDSVVYVWNKLVGEYIDAHPDVRKNLSKKDYITEVEAVLTKDGDFVSMVILKSSGVRGIDEAPGKAFMASGPFENPPKGMIEPDGFVRMRWRFIVSVVESLRYGVEEISPFNYNDGWPDPALQRETWR